MKREIMSRLADWKDSARRKPLLLWGARQVGKSWALKQFGKECFLSCVYLSFDNNPELCHVFEDNHDTGRILKELKFFTSTPIVAGRTLLVLDEIQECEAAFNSLKLFHEEAPQFHIAAAGSLLGVSVKKRNMKVPVGQVDIVEMHPMTFREFLMASNDGLYGRMQGMDWTQSLPETILNQLIDEYRQYLVCGGMPEAVKTLLSPGGTMGMVDEVLGSILHMYELDFAKYATPTEVNRIRYLWQSLPSQLAKENKKFLYRTVRTGARAREYEDALLWLVDAGLVHKVHCVSSPKLPLSAYADLSAFKLYACDCGLLRRLSGLPPQVVQSGSLGYVEFRGALAENAVLQSMVAGTGDIPFYWCSEGRAEVDFLWQQGADIIPVEVKSETRVSGKSLSVYRAKYAPRCAMRISMNNLREDGGLLSLPLPLTDWTPDIIASLLPEE